MDFSVPPSLPSFLLSFAESIMLRQRYYKDLEHLYVVQFLILFCNQKIKWGDNWNVFVAKNAGKKLTAIIDLTPKL